MSVAAKSITSLVLVGLLSACAGGTSSLASVDPVATAISDEITVDIYQLIRRQLPPQSNALTVIARTKVEKNLVGLLRNAGYALHYAGTHNLIKLDISSVNSGASYLAILNLGMDNILVREYRNINGVVKLTSTTVGTITQRRQP